MTTTPITITAELLDDLQRKAKAAHPQAEWFLISDLKCHSNVDLPAAKHIVAANPATILALVEHIRSLTERLERAEKDAGRIDFLVRKEAVVLEGRLGFWLHFQREDIEQNGEYESARSAIDAAIAQDGAENE